MSEMIRCTFEHGLLLIMELLPDELNDCEELAVLWNKEPVPKEVQQKSVAYN